MKRPLAGAVLIAAATLIAGPVLFLLAARLAGTRPSPARPVPPEVMLIPPSSLNHPPRAITYEAMFKEIAALHGLNRHMLAAQAYHESRLDPLAIGQANEMGLMQISPQTWDEWAPKVGVSDPFDPYSNAQVGAAYMEFLNAYFSRQGYPEYRWALAAYNWGPDNLLELIRHDDEWDAVPAQTRRYAASILRGAGHPVVNSPQLQALVAFPKR